MATVNLTYVQKISLSLVVFLDKRTDRQTSRQTNADQHAYHFKDKKGPKNYRKGSYVWLGSLKVYVTIGRMFRSVL